MNETTNLEERWQNVYRGYCIGKTLCLSKEKADSLCTNSSRTHYLKTYWLNGILQMEPKPEWIVINK